MVNVYRNIMSTLKYKKVHMTLIDPAAQSPERSGDLAEKADRAGRFNKNRSAEQNYGDA